jgi:RNA polymerase sigma-70 factor, ECF subfamily
MTEAVTCPDRMVSGAAATDRCKAVAETVPELSTLMTAVIARQDAALAQLYDLTAAKLYGLARAMLGNTADAEEVVCDVYVQVWQTAASFDCTRGSVLAWLMMICRSRALDLLRQRRARAERSVDDMPEEEGAELSPEAVLAQFQEGTAVHRALAQLSPPRRQLVGLAFFKGLSHQEIAAAVNLPIGTVKSHLRRSLLALRDVLDN